MFSLILYFLIFKFSHGIEILSAREETNDLLSRKQNVSYRKSDWESIRKFQGTKSDIDVAVTDNSVDKNTQLTLGNITHKKITGLILIDESEVDIRLGWDWGDYTLFQVKVYRSVPKFRTIIPLNNQSSRLFGTSLFYSACPD